MRIRLQLQHLCRITRGLGSDERSGGAPRAASDLAGVPQDDGLLEARLLKRGHHLAEQAAGMLRYGPVPAAQRPDHVAWLETKLDAVPALAARVANDAEHGLAGIAAVLPEVGLARAPYAGGPPQA
jgi:hypothetical protein